MNKTQQSRYESLYQQHVSALRRQGKSKTMVASHARALRRVTESFQRCPDQKVPGHESPKTTALYTQLTEPALQDTARHINTVVSGLSMAPVAESRGHIGH